MEGVNSYIHAINTEKSVAKKRKKKKKGAYLYNNVNSEPDE